MEKILIILKFTRTIIVSKSGKQHFSRNCKSKFNYYSFHLKYKNYLEKLRRLIFEINILSVLPSGT